MICWKNHKKIKGCDFPLMELFKIVLDQPSKVYRQGDVVRGHVSMVCNRPMSADSIMLRFIGASHVSWQESTRKEEFGEMRQSCETIQDTEHFVNLSLPLCSSGSLQTFHPFRQYVFPFEFAIPFGNLPSSYIGEYGYISYTIICVFSRNWTLFVSLADRLEILSYNEMSGHQMLHKYLRPWS